MYQVSFKFKAPFREPYYDCIFYDSEEDAVDYSNFLKAFDNYSDIRVTSNTINNLVDANKEIIRLRKLLSNAYTELQQLKKDYNSYIKKIHNPKLLLVVNVSEDEVVFYVKEKDNSVVEVKIPKEDFYSPACVLDFDDAEIIDDGLTVRFGQFECAVEHILEYQYQPEEFVDDEESS